MKVGDYVRTDVGIGKYISDNEIQFHDGKGKATYRDIIKSSPNIIDLVEKSDLVVDNYGNIYVVDYVFDNYIYTTTKQGNIIKTLCDYQIKSIVTKEQFENCMYKIGE